MTSFIVAAAVAALATGALGRTLLQDAAAPSPDYAPAPTSTFNGVEGYSCPTPGSTGYLFQTAPCNFGAYAGLAVYCDESTEGDGIVGIRDEFCNIHFNGTCNAVADQLCFAGALAPTPAPAPAPWSRSWSLRGSLQLYRIASTM